MRFSITYRMGLYFIIISLITICFIGSYSYTKTKNALLNRTYEQLTSVSTEKTNRLDKFYGEHIFDAAYIFNSEDFTSLTQEFISIDFNDSIQVNSFKEHFIDFKESNSLEIKQYKGLLFYDQTKGFAYIYDKDSANTDILYYSHEVSFLHLSSLIDSIEHSIFLTDFIQDIDSNYVQYLASSKEYSNSNKCVFALVLPITPISDIMYEDNPHNGLGESGESYLVGDDYLMRSCSRFIPESVLITSVKTESAINAFEHTNGSAIVEDYRGIKVLSSYRLYSINNLRWAVLVEIDYDEAIIPINVIRNNILYLSILFALILTAIITWISRLITQPIKDLKESAIKVSEGDYNTRIKINGKDELSDLSEAFNEMTEKLLQQKEKLEIQQQKNLKAMFDGQELERQRLSRELHDGLAQVLMTIKLKLEQYKQTNDDVLYNEAQELFNGAVKEVRSMSNDLMPAVLKNFGLVKAIKNLCKDVNNSSLINISFESNLETIHANDQTSIYLYRICQEGLNNIVKHSKAKNADIQIEINDNLIFLSISDNGKGFDLDNYVMGNGISNMKERVKIIGGVFAIDTENGTHIVISVPIKK